MWIICYPMLLLAKQYYCMKILWVILCQYYQGNINIHILFSTHLSKTNFAIASSIPWTGFIPIAWLSALNSCTRFSNLFAWCKAWPKATKVSMIRKYHNHTLQAKQRHCVEDRDNITQQSQYIIKAIKVNQPALSSPLCFVVKRFVVWHTIYYVFIVIPVCKYAMESWWNSVEYCRGVFGRNFLVNAVVSMKNDGNIVEPEVM